MKKDIEWLKENVQKRLDKLPRTSRGMYIEGSRDAYRLALKDINQLDEPELPVIPKFVADWIEENHERNTMLELSLLTDSLSSQNMKKEHKLYFWIKENFDTFAEAWIAYPNVGVEKEQKYILSINITDKDSKTNYETFLNKRGIFHSMENESFNSEEFSWTEEEIKDLESGEILFEHFATKIEELEE